jgi:very-short-patch-repair endonuclease/uncharacterized C2H2 Zn-finger protein
MKMVEYKIKHEGVETIACDICGEMFLSKRVLSEHKAKVHGMKTQSQIDKENRDQKPRDIKCEICGETFVGRNWLSRHLSKNHDITPKDYYVKYIIKDKSEMRCKECGNETGFRFDTGFHDFCSFSCSTTWYSKNTNRVKKAMETVSKKKKQDPTFSLNPSQLEYWISKGYGEEEAKQKRKERQRTFTKENLIEKHGKIEGLKIWEDRQKRWQQTLLSKPVEEIERIQRAKMGNGRGYSKISQSLFIDIDKRISNLNVKTYYATKPNCEIVSLNDNYEFMTTSVDRQSCFFLDFYVPSINYCVEFDGDYWHGEKRGNKERDNIRELKIKENNPGITIIHVLERDYKQNPDKVVETIACDIINRIKNAETKKV